MELTPEDKQRIEQAAEVYAKNHSAAPDKETPDWIITDFMRGAEYATIYEREKQAKGQTPMGIPENEDDYNMALHDARNELSNKNPLSIKLFNAVKEIKKPEAERTELRNKVIEECKYAIYEYLSIEAEDKLNSLKK